MTIKQIVDVIIQGTPRLEGAVFGEEFPAHSHARHTGLDVDDHLQYLPLSAGSSRSLSGDLYIDAGIDIRGDTELRLDDHYRDLYTIAEPAEWTEDGIRLSWNQADWQTLYEDNGGMTSLIGAINNSSFTLSIDENWEMLRGNRRLTGGTNILLDPLDDGTGFQISAIIADVKYSADSLSLVVGDYVSGDVDSTHDWQDGDEYEIAEVSGTPGFDLRFSFSGVSGINKVSMYLKYDGAGSHIVQVELYNYNTTTFTSIGTFTLSVAYQVYEFVVPIDTDYIDSGDAIVRFNHAVTGNPNHDLHVDYLALVRAATSAGGVTDHGSLTGLTDTSDHAWAFLIDGTRAMTGYLNLAGQGLTDSNRAGSDWASSGIELSTNSTNWDDIETLIGSEGSIFDAILAAAGSLSGLTEDQLVFGSATGTTEQTVNLTYNDGLFIGDGTPGSLSGSDTLYVEGIAEFDAAVVFDAKAYFYGGALFNDNVSLHFGSVSDSLVVFNALQTNDSLMLGVDTVSKTLIVTDIVDVATNYNHSVYSDPTLVIQSSDATDVTKYISAQWGGFGALIRTENGSIGFQDIYLDSSAWDDPYITIFGSDSGPDDLTFVTTESDHSLSWYIVQALQSGTTLNGSYDFGGAGVGRSITADTGAVAIANAGQNIVLAISNTGVASTDDVINFYNDSNDAIGIYFSGDAGDFATTTDYDETEYLDGHRLYVNKGILAMVCEEDTATRENVSTVSVRRIGDTPDGYITQAALLSAHDTGAFYHYARVATYVSVTSPSTWSPKIRLETSGSVAIAGAKCSFGYTPVSHTEASASWSNVSDTITAVWTTPERAVTIDDDCVAVDMTAPVIGSGEVSEELHLIITASGADRTLTGFSDVTWTGNFDPDSVPYTIPSGGSVTVELYYFESTDSYRGRLIPEVEVA